MTGTWTTIAYEAQFLAAVAADSDRVTVTAPATSTTGLPMHRVDITTATGNVPTIMFVGLQHGNENAGREGLLTLIRDLAVTTDSAWVSLLDRARIVVLPNTNPGGFPDHRNIPGQPTSENPNRQHLSLEYAEQRFIQQTITDVSPVIVIDCHEDPNTEKLRPQAAMSNAAYAGLYATGLQLAWAIRDWASSNGIPNEFYGNVTHPGLLTQTAQLRHAVGVLIEVSKQPSDAERVTTYSNVLGVVIGWLDGHLSDLVTASAASRAWAAGNVTERDFPFPLAPTGVTINPPPISYRNLAAWPVNLDVLGIDGSTTEVLMLQDGALLIPYLLDPDSQYKITTATRNAPPVPQPAPEQSVVPELWVRGKRDGVVHPVAEIIHKRQGELLWVTEAWRKADGVQVKVR
ncbi:M14 family zinc carboxypeptidase [Microbacterium resistens]